MSSVVIHNVGSADSKRSKTFCREFMDVYGVNGVGSDVYNGFSVMQWNALADGLHDSFPQVDPSILPWSYRKAHYLTEIRKYLPDVCCLEEVNHFHDFLKPEMEDLGYEGIFQEKIQSPCTLNGYPADGCAIFYKKDLLQLESSTSFALKTGYGQIALIARLRKKSKLQKDFFVCCAHFKAKASEECDLVRIDQIRHLLDRVFSFAEEANIDDVVVCCDFNTEPGTKAYEIARKRMSSAYEVENKEPRFTTWKFRDKEYKRTIDYIFYSGENLQVRKILRLPREEEIGMIGLPTEEFPSDHLSLVAEFDLSEIY